MNAFDYFFEKSHGLDKDFLIGKNTLSYRELYSSSLSLAAWIQKDIGTGKHVLIMAPNSAFFIIAYLAVLKSGNIVIPIDPSMETENALYIISQINPALAFIDLPANREIKKDNLKLIGPDNIPEAKSTNLQQPDVFEQTAEILFTSGSTGKPKGVMLSHKNLVANTSSIIEYLELTENDRMLEVLPFFYCYGLSLLHTHLRVGGSMVLNNSFIFLGNIIKQLKEYSCTGFAGVPSHFQILLRKTKSFRETDFPALRYVTQAGGGLSTVFIDEFRESFPKVSFNVMYGQTEATARLAWLPPEMYDKKKGSIGKAIPGVSLKLVSPDGQEVSEGETGEILAGGDNIMQGYYKDEKATDEVLKGGWLYTGDLATRDKDGFLFLTARKKEIIKSGGKRISPAEISEAIMHLSEVVDCQIDTEPDDVLGEAIIAKVYVQSLRNNKLNEESIRKHCEELLVSYKVPRRFELLDKINMSATGKKVKT